MFNHHHPRLSGLAGSILRASWKRASLRRRYCVGHSQEKHFESEEEQEQSARRIKKRNFALLTSFRGANYCGFECQKLDGVDTISGTLLKAIKIIGAASEEEIALPAYSLRLKAVSRTDSGVSAVRHICSMVLPIDTDVEEINQHLPEDIRVMTKIRVPNRFQPHKKCSGREYSYILPTYAFVNHKQQPEILRHYRIDADRVYKVNDLLKFFQGSHKFHNYTSKKDISDPSAWRVMFKLSCSSPYLVGDVEFMEIYIKGQSFMLHQIRKMIGMVIAVMRGKVSSDIMRASFSEPKLPVPTAPALGLILEKAYFDKYKCPKEMDELDFSEHEHKCLQFKSKYIVPHIVGSELRERSAASPFSLFDNTTHYSHFFLKTGHWTMEAFLDNIRRHSFFPPVANKGL